MRRSCHEERRESVATHAGDLDIGIAGIELVIVRLATAFAQAAGRHRGWRPVIYGEGFARDCLLAQRARLGLGSVVGLPGLTQDLDRELRGVAVSALSSRYKGMPDALVEAMAAATGCVGFDCASNPGEMLRQGACALPAQWDAVFAHLGRGDLPASVVRPSYKGELVRVAC